jgi:hypothetical protein
MLALRLVDVPCYTDATAKKEFSPTLISHKIRIITITLIDASKITHQMPDALLAEISEMR